MGIMLPCLTDSAIVSKQYVDEGENGKVWEGQMKASHRRIAIKTLKGTLRPDLLITECKALLSLDRTKRIPKLLGIQAESGQPQTMYVEFIPGQTLVELMLATERQIPFSGALSICRKVRRYHYLPRWAL